jgi:hypothetical protein
MAVDETVSAGCFQFSEQLFQRGVVNLDFGVAFAADEVMVVVILRQSARSGWDIP